jgi:hypothetical protein
MGHNRERGRCFCRRRGNFVSVAQAVDHDKCRPDKKAEGNAQRDICRPADGLIGCSAGRCTVLRRAAGHLRLVTPMLRYATIAVLSAIAVAALPPMVLGEPALWLQLFRTCHGNRCLDQFRVGAGYYQIPGLTCFRPIPFYSPSTYERHPNMARAYFVLLYEFVGKSVVIYLTEKDRYIVIFHNYQELPDLVEAEFCKWDFKFRIKEELAR